MTVLAVRARGVGAVGQAAQGLQQSVAYLPGAAFKKRLDGVSRENAALIPSMNLDKN